MKREKKTILTIAIIFAFSLSNLKAQTTGTFTDKRDEKTYKTVQIGEQVWFAENLAFKVSYNCWAYDNDKKNVSKYGYLYTQKVAQNICPNGWHLPSDEEWTSLINFLGGEDIAGEKLKNSKGWNLQENKNYGNNSSGFSALPGGYHYYFDNRFHAIGDCGIWWTATQYKEGAARAYELNAYGRISRIGINTVHGYSVRCIKN